jgi:hypothetical protein
MTQSTDKTEYLDESTRGGLERVLDVILPGTETLPSGRDASVHQEWLDRVLAAEPRLFDALRRVGDAAAAGSSCTLSDIQSWAGDDLESVIFAVQAAYYMSPVAKKAHRYPGQVRRPIAQATPEESWSEELMAPVINRGPIYVPTPSQIGVE